MRKKWGPFIGGILIGLVIMAMNYKYVVNDDNLVYKNNLVYEKEKDNLLQGQQNLIMKIQTSLNLHQNTEKENFTEKQKSILKTESLVKL